MQEKLDVLLRSQYGSAVLLFTVMFIGLLLFLVIHYKRKLTQKEKILNEKDEKIKSLRQYSYEMELKRVEREHEVEKEILNLNHTISELETKQHEGLKNQVVNKIEEYQTKRAKILNRAGIN
jgi:F0F1-type ATP synthase membrane subunit b/b'